MWLRNPLVAVLAVALFLVPSASAEPVIDNPQSSTPTTLYFHLAGLQDFPINTQPPDDRYGAASSKGLATATVTCADMPGTGIDAQHHTYYGYSTAGPVQYDVQEQGGPRIHTERGIAGDVLLDTGTEPVLWWYMETMMAPNQEDLNGLPVVVPNVVVQATMRTGDDVSVGNEAFEEGAIVAQGRTAPALLMPGTDGAVYEEVDGRHVYGFAVPLGLQADMIPGEEGYNVRVDVFVENAACADSAAGQMLMPNQVALHTSPGHRPRMELAVLNPISLNSLHPQFIGDELVIHSGTITPWGNYDVDTAGMRLVIDGPSSPLEIQRVVMNPHDVDGHYGHGNDILATWVWPFKEEGAKPGVYTVRLEAPNLQGTAVATGESTFQVGDGCVDCEPRAETADGLGPGTSITVALTAAAVLAVGAAAWRRLR